MIIAGNGVVARIDHRQLDVQRATQAYLEFMPLASQNSIFEAHIRDYGWKPPSDIQVYIEPGAGKAGAIGLQHREHLRLGPKGTRLLPETLQDLSPGDGPSRRRPVHVDELRRRRYDPSA